MGVALLLLMYVTFIFLTLTSILLSPLDAYLKRKLIAQAKEKMKQYPEIKVIGIAGSYGKTTMKELLYSMLKQKYHVVKTPKNINTPLGIYRQIMKEINHDTQYFIVELG
jgi:UDP-N-acetylmuramoyl-tripeptide--D-alanyl-D-alanine ligase